MSEKLTVFNRNTIFSKVDIEDFFISGDRFL